MLDISEKQSPITVEYETGMAWVTLNRPKRANAFNISSVQILLEVLSEVEKDENVRAIILSGAGTNFCAGADLTELLATGEDGVRRLMDLFRQFTLKLECSRLATIAVVQGAARAGGLELALACDVVLAARSATFGDAHVANGLLPAGGSTARLHRTIGWHRAKWLLLSGDSIDADTAHNWGLVHEVTEEADIKMVARSVAQSLAQSDIDTFGKVKNLLAMVPDQFLSASLEAEIAALRVHSHTKAFIGGIEKFFAQKK